MIDRAVEIALRARALVVVAVILILILGVHAYRELPIDAFPDISPIMVPVFAEAHGWAPEEVERLITYPIESSMNGLPGVVQVKSTSAFGMAVIYVYFADGTDVYFARQLVSERLAGAMNDLPDMHEPPTLGPISTGLGQVFIYYLTLAEGADTQGKDPGIYLREVNDWMVEYQLRTVPGVTDILSIGGHVLQYQIDVDPQALRMFDIGIQDVAEAVQANNATAGGQFLVLGSEENLVRGVGLLQTVEDIAGVPVKVVDGVAVTIGHVAEVHLGPGIRRGVVTRNGAGEVVSGIVLKLYGENTSRVIDRLYAKVAEVQAGLPDGVQLVAYYEQAELVRRATGTVKQALLLGAVLVILTLVAYLGNLRTALIVGLALPLSALAAVLGMTAGGLSANLMSLGGIAIGIGMLADGAIVMVENIHRHLSREKRGTSGETQTTILAAAHEVGRPIVFSLAIIIIVFVPLFSLQGIEGKMFRPMAFTIAFALLGSMITAILVAPALSSLVLRRGAQRGFSILSPVGSLYRRLLARALRGRRAVLGAALALFLVSGVGLGFLGTEFIPTLEEGSILIGVTMAPSISLEHATTKVMALERQIVAYPEVEETVSRIGRPEAGSHPHPVNYAEIHVTLRPREQWKSLARKEELIDALARDLSVVPGVQLTFTQPIQNAFDELLSGIKAQVAVKVFGEDLDLLRAKADEIHAAIRDVPGLVDLTTEQSFGQPQVRIVADREACARYGVEVRQILEQVELGIAGAVVDQLYLETRRFGIQLRYQERFRGTPEAIRGLLVEAGDGVRIPLGEVARVEHVTGPVQINRESSRRRWTVQGNVRGRDLGGVVKDIRERIGERVQLPPGYFVELGGQFESQQRAMTRLAIIVPIALAMVFLLLWLSTRRARHAAIILLNVPLGLIGGVLGLLLTGEYLSVPAAVGFIALFGIAVQNGVVLVTFLTRMRAAGTGVRDAVLEGSVLRVRPVLMTATTTILGLVPLLLARGIGSEVQRPLAAVVVFGLASSTLLTLFVVPVVYDWVEERRERRSKLGAARLAAGN